MKIYHNSQLPEYRTPSGAVPCGSSVRLSIKAADCGADYTCELNLWQEDCGDLRFPMEKQIMDDGSLCFTVCVNITQTPSLCWYYFLLKGSGQQIYYGNNSRQLGGEGQIWDQVPPAFQITAYQPAAVPDWYKSSVVYQIFPDRFARSEDWIQRQAAADKGPDWKGPARVVLQNWNDTPFYTKNSRGEITRWAFFGGTLEGIREHLFYLKSMGAGAIYLNPIFSAASNHKYDTADYQQIDPSFGTDEDFRRLASDAKRLGIRLILDGVFNHTGADSIYFNRYGNYPDPGACQGDDSPYYKWFRFSRFPDQYQCWWGVEDLPDVEEQNPDYQKFIYEGEDSVVRRWLREGASGWRLDVADELPDSFIQGIRGAIRQTNREGLLLGEVWEDASNKVSYGIHRRYLLGNELDGVMNYPMREALLSFMLGKQSADDAVRQLRSLAENYPPENFYSCLNLIGSHDRPRILTLLGDPPPNLTDPEKEEYRLPEDKLRLAKNRLKVLSLLQFILPGVPCIYYGDEAGLQGFDDPLNRGTYPWGREDSELLAHYRMLAGLRKQYPFLVSGGFSLQSYGEHVILCERRADSREEQILAVVNRHLFGNVSVEVELPQGAGWVFDLITAEPLSSNDGTLFLDLPPLSAKLLYCRKKAPAELPLPRAAGVLCHVSSLPSGRLDETAQQFIDFLETAGQKLWQVLPLNPTDKEGNSPYSSPAVFAGNTELCHPEYKSIDSEEYRAFCREESFWLDDFALYTVLKLQFDDLPWQKWPEEERNRRNLDYWKKAKSTDLEEIKKQQFFFWKRWQQVKSYANKKGISIIGDLPLYVGIDSADTWSHPEYFLLGEDGFPLAGAGVPPDYFNENGQNWGNPLYDWDSMKKDGYLWWTERISQAIRRFDYVRIDHFRSFSAFYAIPQGKTAREGYWLPGAGHEFFETLTEKLGPLPFLAEDLGLLDPQVRSLLALSGYPGMLVYQFSEEEMRHLPKDIAERKIFYTGTHDNQTLTGWCEEHSLSPDSTETIIRELYESPAAWVITPLQDLLGLGNEARMNIPGQTKGNWKWRAEASHLTTDLAKRVASWAAASCR